ncbi:UNVERIFIED_CONTAM: hypothetical protein Slati_4320900 [Sesamum latifolium]|uniref:Mitochondrial carrier protein n=1 Tax=Sesamum latifolium TaxID=2727402 RepID=A0AAW2SNC0_9LAMI
MLSTADLISAVGYAWSRAKKPLSVLLPKTNSSRETKVIPEGGILHYCTDKGTFPASNLAYDQPCPIYLNSKANSGKVQENVENLKVNWKTSWPQPCYENFPFQRIVLTKSTMTGGSSIENFLWSTGIPPNFRSIYGWMSELALAKQKNQKMMLCMANILKRLIVRSSLQDDADTQDTNIASSTNDLENSIEDNRNGRHEHHDQRMTFVQADPSEVEISLSGKEKPVFTLAKQEHAVAGAMAGIFVSLCLHPMDTVKTVIQSCRADQKPLHSIGKSIIAEKRNITLWQHCTAGGCASIATSFIFTPSERIKQQMQVGSHYRNCWNALIQVVQKGGFPSLYAGWGAVLCRNVPHSVIKLSHHVSYFVQLVCGGLAGYSWIYDYTTYNGVFNTLKEIGKQEGLKGLYRGLTPRLVMYMVQGALFFASYESFKQLFSLEVHQLGA